MGAYRTVLTHFSQVGCHACSARFRSHAFLCGPCRLIAGHIDRLPLCLISSQRYPKVPTGIQENALPLSRRPIIAFDGMVVRFSELPLLPLFTPAVAYGFGQGEEAGAGAGQAGEADAAGDWEA